MDNDDEFTLRDKILGYAMFYVPQVVVLLTVWYVADLLINRP